ncbi:unnamed protein product, partial [Prorocentrum cordatum]
MPSGSAHCRRVRPRAEAPGEEEGPVGAAAKQGVPAPAARLPPGLAAELARLGSERAVALGAAMQWQLECARHEPLAVRRRVFRELQLQLHPDKNVDCQDA